MFLNTDMMIRKVRVETDTKAEAVGLRKEYGGTAIKVTYDSGMRFYWFSMPYFNEDIEIEFCDSENDSGVEFIKLEAGEIPS